MRCLVVAASATRRRIMMNAVRDEDSATFMEADTVAAALQQAGNGVDLVLTGWNLPDRSGLELLQELRALPDTSATPVIMVTARNRREDVLQAVEAGVTAYVMRPFTTRVLRERIRPCVAAAAAS